MSGLSILCFFCFILFHYLVVVERLRLQTLPEPSDIRVIAPTPAAAAAA